MHERIRLINHHGKQVLEVDLSNCSAVEVEKIARAVPRNRKVSGLNRAVGWSQIQREHRLTRKPFEPMKESAVFDKPYIKKSAWVGAESFPEAFRDSLKSFSRREFPTFQTRQEALDWLVED
jgi:hypothetical protein